MIVRQNVWNQSCLRLSFSHPRLKKEPRTRERRCVLIRAWHRLPSSRRLSSPPVLQPRRKGLAAQLHRHSLSIRSLVHWASLELENQTQPCNGWLKLSNHFCYLLPSVSTCPGTQWKTQGSGLHGLGQGHSVSPLGPLDALTPCRTLRQPFTAHPMHPQGRWWRQQRAEEGRIRYLAVALRCLHRHVMTRSGDTASQRKCHNGGEVVEGLGLPGNLFREGCGNFVGLLKSCFGKLASWGFISPAKTLSPWSQHFICRVANFTTFFGCCWSITCWPWHMALRGSSAGSIPSFLHEEKQEWSLSWL